ncbi:hypothetical protein [Bacillus sp. AK031]
MENLIFLVIAGLISMLFNRMKQNPPKEEPRSPRPAADRQEEYTEPETFFDKGIEEIETQGRNKFLEKQQEAKQRIAQLKSQEEQYNRRAQRVKVSKKAPVRQEAQINLRNLDRNDIVKGIVFSEILGPPRAKKKNWRG